MYAIVESGGKQYKVTNNQYIVVEKQQGDVGDIITLDKILAFNSEELKIGNPTISNMHIKATIVEQNKQKKVNIIKFKRRKHHMKRMGHRQQYTKLLINSIEEK